jgi:hypothetical protein
MAAFAPSHDDQIDIKHNKRSWQVRQPIKEPSVALVSS